MILAHKLSIALALVAVTILHFFKAEEGEHSCRCSIASTINHLQVTLVSDCWLEFDGVTDGDEYPAGQQINLTLKHNCRDHGGLWDNDKKNHKLFTEGVNDEYIFSNVTIIASSVVEGNHSLSCYLDNGNITASITITVINSKLTSSLLYITILIL